MRYLVLLLALAMPVVAWLSNSGLFGPTNGEISDRYPTLIVAAGYAFAVWGPIFLLDLVYAIGEIMFGRYNGRTRRIRPYTATAFAMTSLWMVAFSRQYFWLALIIIWVSLGCLLRSAHDISEGLDRKHGPWWAWLPLSLHAGWVSLAAFLNIAQVLVAFQLVPVDHMLPWACVLFFLLALLLMHSIARMQGNPWYALAAVWGLAGVYMQQSHSTLPGAAIAGWIALFLACVVAVQSGWLLLRDTSGRLIV